MPLGADEPDLGKGVGVGDELACCGPAGAELLCDCEADSAQAASY